MQNNKIGLWQYIYKYKISIFFHIIFTLLGGVLLSLVAIISAKTIEYITLSEYEKATSEFILLLIISLAKWISWYIASGIFNKTGGNIISDMNYDLSKQSFRLSSKTYSDNASGVFVERIVNDPRRVVESLSGVLNTITGIMSSLIVIIYIATLNFIICLIVLFLVFGCLVIEFFRQKAYRKNSKKVYEVDDKVTSLTNEIIRSEKDIKSLGLESTLADIAKKNYDMSKKMTYKQEMTELHFWRGRNLLIDVGTIFMLIVGMCFLDKALITMATFMIIYTYKSDIYELVWNIGNIANIFISIKVSCERMFSLFNEELFEIEKFGDVKVDNIIGDVEFKNVSFIYKDYSLVTDKKTKKETRVLDSSKVVFDDLNFKIPHNKTVAFVGKSGAGKSTILSLLSKIYSVDNGEILIDSYNIETLDKQTLRKTFSLVNQFPYIFDMTIKENLLMAKKDASDEEIIFALKQAYLYEFVSSLKDGIDTKVGENGIKLSGGQKQRFAIARALLRNSPIILFDESTSSLDNFAQEEVKKSIDSLKGKSTIVIVAHRLSTIKDVDLIFFLDEGKIIDQGTFKDLFETNEKFKNMFLMENI